MQLHPRVPGELGDRVRQLLEPWLVRAPAIVQHRRRKHDEHGIAGAAVERGRGWRAPHQVSGLRPKAHRLCWSVGVDAAMLQRFGPEFVERLTVCVPRVQRAPTRLEVVLEGLRLPGQVQ